MATHRYLLADLVTDQTIGWLPLDGVSYSRRISAQGDFSGGFPIVDHRLGGLAQILTQKPCALYALRDGVLWWGGIIWSTTPRRDRRGVTRCELVGATFDSITNQRRIFTDIDYDDVPAGLIVADLWARLQDGPGANVGVEWDDTPTGQLWSGSWAGTDAKTWAEAIKDATETDPVLEWTIDMWADPDGTRRRRIRTAPTLGDQSAGHYIISPKTLVTWAHPSTHTSHPTHVQGRGQSLDGSSIPITTPVIIDAEAIAAGNPRVDVLVDVDTDDDQVLVDHAHLAITDRRPPDVTIRLGDTVRWQPGMLGDTVRGQITDPYFEDGRLLLNHRAIGVKVTPAERGRDEEITLEFAGADQ